MSTSRRTDAADGRAWVDALPMRFNAPSGWARPTEDWTLRHIGLERSDVWMPEGAGPLPEAGWAWWLPQEPAWSEWMRQEAHRYGLLRRWSMVGVILGPLIAISAWQSFRLLAAMGILVAVAALIGMIIAVVFVRHFRKDPMGAFRDRYLPHSTPPGGGGF